MSRLKIFLWMVFNAFVFLVKDEDVMGRDQYFRGHDDGFEAGWNDRAERFPQRGQQARRHASLGRDLDSP